MEGYKMLRKHRERWERSRVSVGLGLHCGHIPQPGQVENNTKGKAMWIALVRSCFYYSDLSKGSADVKLRR